MLCPIFGPFVILVDGQNTCYNQKMSGEVQGIMDKNYVLGLMKDLLAIPSPGGFTADVINRMKQEFDDLGIAWKQTNKGAIYATLKGRKQDAGHRVISTHVDTLGAMVRNIKDNGRLQIVQIGGFPLNNIEGENVQVHTAEGKIHTGTGLPVKSSVHIYGSDVTGSTERSIDNFEIRLDADTRSLRETEALGIRTGDFISFEPRTVICDTGYIKSRFLDDKACVALAMGVLKDFLEQGRQPAYTSHFFISDYEEIGHGIYGMPPETFEVLALDIGPVGEQRASDEKAVTIAARDSRTPYPFEFRNKLRKLAEANGVNYRIDVHIFYGSDASMQSLQGNDINFACFGPGVDGTHHYERCHYEALENSMKLLNAYLLSE